MEDLLCLGVMWWGGYRSAFDGVQEVFKYGSSQRFISAGSFSWSRGHYLCCGSGPTFWEKALSKLEEGKAGKLTPSPSLSLPEPLHPSKLSVSLLLISPDC